eukprot:CAMPEP_0201102778 /NCGR_PEP_ID=MMETSP0812-20130820/20288_1 /ASSEMBLY_ACC=CAM_ASM_000668 /TAXON_ID=98059 /ORGANISM="Dinobryon sp., Strain UTEXLB2267" /LENGTH=698 /DNA_ID=CAMNT_0047360485 /DNA_START=253 /DNA_END=2346 /DNA_ORIENTATION=-
MGTCDRSAGICKCRKGFGGSACDMMLCPIGTISDIEAHAYLGFTTKTQPCSGRGRCLSLREISQYKDYSTYLGYTSYFGWDADMIHGCLCDSGWEGVACEKRSCPKGDDPYTPGLDEMQLIDCECSKCLGGLYISFNGLQTPLIPYDAEEEVIQFYLSRLPLLSKVTVKFLYGNQLCSKTGSVTSIVFKSPPGPQNSIAITKGGGLRGLHIAVRAKGDSSSVVQDLTASYPGNKEYVECSNHGICDYTTGICNCFGGYKSSDGFGNSGSIGDCGYQYKVFSNYTKFTPYETVLNGTAYNTTLYHETHIHSKCPFVNNDLCSGNGQCDASTGICYCNSGYGGPACANRTCESSFAWFGNPLYSHTGTAVCGGVGECDGDTGKCINCGGNWGVFYGDRCEYMSCSTDTYGNTCANNGACLTLRQMARYAYNEQKELSQVDYSTPWDADHVRGCVCNRAISVDNQYFPDYRQIIDVHGFNASTLNDTVAYTDEEIIRFYRGPYAYSATDFTNYNCQHALCPKGDNPRTVNRNNTNEIQVLHCQADNGTFLLTFRENTTVPISFNATASELEYHLEQLYTIGDVLVTFIGGQNYHRVNHSVCSIWDNVTVYIEFLTEFGDLPLIQADTSGIMNYGFGIQNYHDHQVMNISEYQKGDKEDIECSGQGLCDQSVGVCTCFDGFQSSNGTSKSPGQRGDCSYFNP